MAGKVAGSTRPGSKPSGPEPPPGGTPPFFATNQPIRKSGTPLTPPPASGTPDSPPLAGGVRGGGEVKPGEMPSSLAIRPGAGRPGSAGSAGKKALQGQLPPEMMEQIDRLLVEGYSYEEISDFISAQGYDLTKTALGKYGKDFLQTYRRLRVIEEKSRALASDEQSGLVLEEAASRLFALMILEAQLAGEIDLKCLPKLLSDFARLQSSNVQRERLRREFKKRVEKTAEEVGQSARRGGLSDAAADEIRRKILGIPE